MNAIGNGMNIVAGEHGAGNVGVHAADAVDEMR